MNKQSVSKFIESTWISVSKHSPEILTGIGIAGMITTTVLAVKATPKALKLIEEEQFRREDVSEGRELKPLEVVKVAWKPYIPAVVTGIMSTACLIGASSVSARRTAALATAYKLSETALSEYREKVVETIGEKKEQLVRDKVYKDKVDKNPVSKNEVVITERGNTLCYDSISGRYFKSDIEKIKQAVNTLNRNMVVDMYVSLNELYDELGLEHISIGDDLGWNIDHGLIELEFGSQIADDGTPCIVVDYRVAPRYDYSKFV